MKKLTIIEKKILNLIRTNGHLTQTEITKLEDISIFKVAGIINNLDSKGMLQKKTGPSSGGRKPLLLKIKDDIFFTMGIEISAQYIRVVIVNANGDIVYKSNLYEPLKEKRTATIQDVIGLGESTLAKMDYSWENIAAIGIGIIGLVDEKNGKCLLLPNALHWKDLKIVQIIKKATSVKHVYLTDSVRAMALSEGRFGSGKNLSDYIFIYIGVYLGSGIVVNKKILSGYKGIIGEISHIYVGGSNELCVCGNYGCLETVASGHALIDKVQNAIAKGALTSISSLEKSIQISDIARAAKDGDKLATNLIEEAVNYLSIGISTIVNLLAPEAVIVFGELATEAGDALLLPLIKNIKAKALPQLSEDITIYQSKLGEYISARGAATLALDKAFNDLF